MEVFTHSRAQSPAQSRARHAAGELRLHAILRLAYMFDTQELASAASRGAAPAPSATAATERASAAALEQPLVRWPLAALTHRWVSQALEEWGPASNGDLALPLWSDELFVQRLASLAASWGAGADALAGAHAALALSPALALPSARAAAWRALADAGALERLPPAAACTGGAAAYCCPLGGGCGCGGGDGSDGGVGADGSGSLALRFFPPSARELSDACARSLAQRETAKSAALGGLTSLCAVHAVAARALADGRAWEGATAAASLNAAAINALRGVVRGAAPGAARDVVRCAARCGGVGEAEATRRAVVACHGDAELMAALARDGVV